MRYGSLLFFFSFFSLALSDTRNPFLAPKGGDVIYPGKQYTIQWSPGSPGPIKIWLAVGGLDPVAVTETWIPNTGIYYWTPPSAYAGDKDVILAICDVSSPAHDCTNTTGGYFAMAAAAVVAAATTTTKSNGVSFSTLTSRSIYGNTSTSTSTSSSKTSLATSSFITSFASFSSSSPTTTSPTSSTTAPPPYLGSSSALSSNAKVALGAILGVFGAFIVILAIFFILLRRKHQKENLQMQSTHIQYMQSTFPWERPEDVGGDRLSCRRGIRRGTLREIRIEG